MYLACGDPPTTVYVFMSQEIIQIPFYETLSSPVGGGQYAPASRKSRSAVPSATRPFVVGEENKPLSLISYEILQNISQPLPVYLFAAAGSGKSHFVEGLFVTWRVLHPRLRGELLSAHDFFSRLKEAMQTQTMQEFQRVFYKLDFLVLEDFHQMATMPFAQQELIRVLDKLRGRQARVMVTSSVALKHVDVDSKLASRLSEGVSFQVQPPGMQTRLAILDLPENQKIGPLSEEARLSLAEYAQQGQSTVYDMLGVLRQLELKRRAEKRRKIMPEDVEAHYQQKAAEHALSISKIAKAVGRYYKVKLADMRSKSRRATLVTARDVVYYLTRKLTEHTLAEIGEYFAGRDHATILHGIKHAEAELKTDPQWRHAVEFLMEELRPAGEIPVPRNGRGRKKG